jgi:RNA polymerase sigma-70 factor (ECF subfamily)
VPTTAEPPLELIAKARTGDPAALGQVLEGYRDYLRLLARGGVGQELRVRLDPSDLVQETLLEAQRDFGQFAGSSEVNWRPGCAEFWRGTWPTRSNITSHRNATLAVSGRSKR